MFFFLVIELIILVIQQGLFIKQPTELIIHRLRKLANWYLQLVDEKHIKQYLMISALVNPGNTK